MIRIYWNSSLSGSNLHHDLGWTIRPMVPTRLKSQVCILNFTTQAKSMFFFTTTTTNLEIGRHEFLELIDSTKLSAVLSHHLTCLSILCMLQRQWKQPTNQQNSWGDDVRWFQAIGSEIYTWKKVGLSLPQHEPALQHNLQQLVFGRFTARRGSFKRDVASVMPSMSWPKEKKGS